MAISNKLNLRCKYFSGYNYVRVQCIVGKPCLTNQWLVHFFGISKFVRVCSNVGRYFYIVYIVKHLKLCFPSMTIVYVQVNIILDFPITHKMVSVLHQSECSCLKYSKHGSFLYTNNLNIYPKGRALM